MIDVLVIGDPHFKVSNVRETDEMSAAILTVARERRPDIIVVLGDLLDRHESIHVSPLNRSVKFLRDLCSITKTYLLVGNHDLKNNRQFMSEEHPFTSMKSWGDSFTVVDRSITDGPFTFVPYVPPGRFSEALEGLPWRSSLCIFAHQEFKGAKMGAIVSEEGDEWDVTHPLVVSGHIHDYQTPQRNIVYVGTPMQHSFGDHHDKTISMFSFSEDRGGHTEDRGGHTEDRGGHTEDRGGHTEERIDLHLTKKHVVHIKTEDVKGFKLKRTGDIKIVISGPQNEIKVLSKDPKITEWKRMGHRVIFKVVQQKRMEAAKTRSFREEMMERMDGDAQLIRVFHSIFGR